MEGGRGKFCTLVALTRPPGLSLRLFSRRKKISLCPQPGTENILANGFMLFALGVWKHIQKEGLRFLKCDTKKGTTMSSGLKML